MLVGCYLILGYYLLGYESGMRGIDVWYYLATTVTTVGFGDFSPQTQVSRGFSVVLLPFGLVVISFGISLLKAYV